MLEISKKISNILSKLPDTPGSYLFFDSKKELIYVGKATSLRSRVKSYWRGQRSPRPIEEMIHEVVSIKWKATDSVLEAIILEAEYIKKFQPKYNVDGKDDKSWNYIVITRGEFPKVETMREREYKLTNNNEQLTRRSAHVFGPYPGLNTKAAMKLLRRMFRFSNCEPPATQPSHPPLPRPSGESIGRPCLYRQMGWCPGVCTGEISAMEYRRQVIRLLTIFLSGRKKQALKMFAAEMKRASKEDRFEDAARLRDQLKSLQRIQDIALLNKSWFDKTTDYKLQTTAETLHGAVVRSPLAVVSRLRIEGYDISNLGANEKVGSMVVFDQNGPVKSEYRKFLIKTVPGQSDVDCLAEVIERRLGHPEWPLPNVFLIDGGRPQVNRARQVLAGTGRDLSVQKTPIVGIAKGPERKRNDFILNTDDTDFSEDSTDSRRRRAEFVVWVSQNRQLLMAVRDEAHRFAVTFHRQRRDRAGRS